MQNTVALGMSDTDKVYILGMFRKDREDATPGAFQMVNVSDFNSANLWDQELIWISACLVIVLYKILTTPTAAMDRNWI